MLKENQRGEISSVLISLICTVLLLLGALGFGFWAFTGRQDYKNNVDAKISDAVKVAKAQEATTKDAQFAEDEKNPLKTYNGPSEYGSVSIQYPKTWSAYVSDDGTSEGLVDGYFQPDVVPNVSNQANSYALRVQVVQQTYSDLLKNYTSQVQAGKVMVNPYKLPNVSSIVGSRVDGQITSTKTGSMILLPLRDKTLKVWTESDKQKGDFDNIILAHLTFVP